MKRLNLKDILLISMYERLTGDVIVTVALPSFTGCEKVSIRAYSVAAPFVTSNWYLDVRMPDAPSSTELVWSTLSLYVCPCLLS